MNETRKTNLDAVKDFIAVNGVNKFISVDWLDANVFDMVREVKDALEEYKTFEEIFDDVLSDGMTEKWKNVFLEEVGEYLSEDDIQMVKDAFVECENYKKRKRMEIIKEFAEQVKGKTVMISYFLDDDSFSVGFRDATPVIDITDDGYCLSVDLSRGNLKIKNADIIHYEDDEGEGVNDVFGKNWYGFILDNDTRILAKIND